MVTRLLFVCMEGVSGDSKGRFGDEEIGERWGEGGRGEIVVYRKRQRERHGAWCIDTQPFMFTCASSSLVVTSPHLPWPNGFG